MELPSLWEVLSKVVPMNLIQLIAGIMFVFFGIMALRDSDTGGNR